MLSIAPHYGFPHWVLWRLLLRLPSLLTPLLLQDSTTASLESSIRWADGFLLLYSITQRPSFLEVPGLKRLIDQTKQSLGGWARGMREGTWLSEGISMFGMFLDGTPMEPRGFRGSEPKVLAGWSSMNLSWYPEDLRRPALTALIFHPPIWTLWRTLFRYLDIAACYLAVLKFDRSY